MRRFGTMAIVPGLCLGLALAAGCGKNSDSTNTSQTPQGNPPPGGMPPGGMPPGGMPPGGMPGRGVVDPEEVFAKLPGGKEFDPGKKVYADKKSGCAMCHKLGETGRAAGGFLGGMPGRPGGPGGGVPGPGGPGGGVPGPGGPGGGVPGPGGPGGPPGPGRPGGGGPGPGGMPGGPPSGPDLTLVAAVPEHTKQWLADHIRDPHKHKQDSRMPNFGQDKISDDELDKLTTYLASRKEEPPPKETPGKVPGKDPGKDNTGKDNTKEPGK